MTRVGVNVMIGSTRDYFNDDENTGHRNRDTLMIHGGVLLWKTSKTKLFL